MTECHPVIAHLGKRKRIWKMSFKQVSALNDLLTQCCYDIIAGNKAGISLISFGFLVESTTFSEEGRIWNYFIIKYEQKKSKKNHRRTKCTNAKIKILLVFCFRKMLGRFVHGHLCSVFYRSYWSISFSSGQTKMIINKYIIKYI